MTNPKRLPIIVIGFVVVGWGTRLLAQEQVTIISPAKASASSTDESELAPDGTPVVHKSFHKNGSSLGAALGESQKATTVKTTTGAMPSEPTLGPAVETGLPVARHSLTGGTENQSAPIPITATVPSANYSDPTVFQHKPSLPPIFPDAGAPKMVASYSSPITTTSLEEDGPLGGSDPADKKGPKNSYPWKTNIITTMFYIGEGDTPISRMTNLASAWDEDWRGSNGGSDSPDDRIGYTPAHHWARINPFYVALPFNDLAYPDKSRRWLPKGWYRAPKDGKQVSACQHRWVEIKTEDGSGRICYAQWEDVGPLRSDQPEYVFGSDRPIGLGGNHAGLDVSPAVRDYLHLDSDKIATTRWRFVDADDVPPGEWLKLDEEAVLDQAFHDMKKSGVSSPPIQKAAAPIEDQQGIDSDQKRVGTAKG